MNISKVTLLPICSGFQKVVQNGVGDSDKIHSTGCDGCCHYDNCSTSFLCSSCAVYKKLQLGS